MKSLKKWSLLALLGTGLMSLSVSHASDQVGYPTGYQDWSHIKSMVIKPGHPLANPFQGIHHVYANAKAKRGLKSGHYEDGAMFVFDLLQYIEADKTLQESDRKLVGVMKMDKRQFAKTGGWGFEGFAGDSQTKRLVGDGGQSCFACHLSQKDKGYVFTQLRD